MFGSVLLFFEFGAGEIMFIMLVALLLFGGDKLPELARGLGKGIRDFKDASEGVKREITNQIDNFEAKKAEQAVAKSADEVPAADQGLVVDRDAPVVDGHMANSVPIAEIGASAEVEPVKDENNTPAEPVHLKETPIEPQAGEHNNAAHEEYKS